MFIIEDCPKNKISYFMCLNLNQQSFRFVTGNMIYCGYKAIFFIKHLKKWYIYLFLVLKILF